MVLSFAGGAFAKVWNYSLDVSEVSRYNQPIKTTLKVNSLSDTIYLSVKGKQYEDDQGFWYYGSGNVNTQWVFNALSASIMLRYERNDCDNKKEQESPASYVATVRPVQRAICRYNGSIPSGAQTDSFFVCKQPGFSSFIPMVYGNATEYNYSTGKYSFICNDRTYQNETCSNITNCGSDYFVAVSRNGRADTCAYTSNTSCQFCSWPYLSVRDTTGCGCKVDGSKYQPADQLRKVVYTYCNTISTDGTQYYLDESRSNFESSNGEIYGACSSPASGQTYYYPVGSCPQGSILDTLQDSTAQTATGTVKKPLPVTSGPGGGGGTGQYDSIIRDRLDSILYGHSVASDSLDAILGRYADGVDSAIAGVQGGLDSLEALGAFHGMRYDTTSVEGVSLDSLLNICWTFDHERKCISDTEHYSVLVTWFKWIRRFYLILWGFICAWIFFKLATYRAD